MAKLRTTIPRVPYAPRASGPGCVPAGSGRMRDCAPEPCAGSNPAGGAKSNTQANHVFSVICHLTWANVRHGPPPRRARLRHVPGPGAQDASRRQRPDGQRLSRPRARAALRVINGLAAGPPDLPGRALRALRLRQVASPRPCTRPALRGTNCPNPAAGPARQSGSGSSAERSSKMRPLLSPIACRRARIAAMVRADRHDHGRGWRRSSRWPRCRPRHRGRRQRGSLVASETACAARTR